MNILQVCSFAAAYEGNFLKTLFALEDLLREKGHNVLFAFPKAAEDMVWCRKLKKRAKVFFLPHKNSRLNFKAYPILKKIVRDESIGLIHSHFESYDIVCKMAAKKQARVFWHLHDPIVKARRPYKNIIIKLQYSFFGKGVTLISVCDYYRDVAVSLGFAAESARTVLNGIDLDRITYPYPEKKIEYDFMTFGWDFYRKGVDIIINVLKRLYNEGYRFRFLLNCNENTLPVLNNYLQGDIPPWIETGGAVDNINEVYEKVKTLVQASRSETFSYAACEAAYAGLDVIASDIPGLEWAKTIPSVSFFEKENEQQLYLLLKQRLDEGFELQSSNIKRSRELIENNFSENKWARNIFEEYGMD